MPHGIVTEVEGSSYEPYRVELELSSVGEIKDWVCSCPYDGAICKHVVAVLLAIEEDEEASHILSSEAEASALLE